MQNPLLLSGRGYKKQSMNNCSKGLGCLLSVFSLQESIAAQRHGWVKNRSWFDANETGSPQCFFRNYFAVARKFSIFSGRIWFCRVNSWNSFSKVSKTKGNCVWNWKMPFGGACGGLKMKYNVKTRFWNPCFGSLKKTLVHSSGFYRRLALVLTSSEP